ncbi:hypothetical protein BpHYR1_051096, partial [Brachionus plicatilis]
FNINSFYNYLDWQQIHVVLHHVSCEFYKLLVQIFDFSKLMKFETTEKIFFELELVRNGKRLYFLTFK